MAPPWRAFAAVAACAYFLLPRTTGLSFSATFLTALAAQFFVYYVVWQNQLYPKFFSPLRHLPHPSGNSWYNGQWHRISTEPPGTPHLEWINSIPNNGLIRFLGLLNQERLVPVSAEALGEVLVKKNYDFTKPPDLAYSIGRILGIGILLAEGEEHKYQRRTLSPAFAFRHIKELVPIFWDKSRDGVLFMEGKILAEAEAATAPQGEGEVDEKKPPAAAAATTVGATAVLEVSNWASRMTLDIIGLTGLGRDFGTVRDPDNELARTYSDLFKPSRQARLLAMMQLIIPGRIVNLLPVKRNSTVVEAAKMIRGVCRDLIAEKKQKLAAGKTAGAAGAAGVDNDVDILSVALESGGFSDENLVDQLMTFLAAGHETTASALTWAIYMLCLHPEVQTRLREEVRSRLPSLDDPAAAAVSALDIDRMPYLNAVCSEVLRYYPPVPQSVRVAAVDTSIGGQPVPKGTRIMIVPWAVNRSYELWGPDANAFNPDRWLPRFEGDKGAASGHARNNYAFLTFFHGPRSCIGQGYAKAEFACLLATWVGRLAFELRDPAEMDEKNMKIKGGVTARPADGLWVKATVLGGW